MIVIKNKQRLHKIDTKQVKEITQKILDLLDYTNFDLGIWFTTNTTIRKYNRTYRNKDKPTDILSFSHHPELRPGKRIQVHQPEDKNLGDLIISAEYLKKDAPLWHQTFEERLVILLIHGICHLLGYDHENDQDYKIMKKKETLLLKLLKK